MMDVRAGVKAAAWVGRGDAMATRIEKDSMGEMTVPAEALWGATTQRAVENFPVSGYRFGRRFIRAMGLIKQAAAKVNRDLGKLDEKKADLILRAAQEVVDGKLDDHFVLDIFQTGSGTSTNMNANEVIANRAAQIGGGKIGSKEVHPNDHVNMGQSSNDVIPAAIHVAAAEAMRSDLVPALEALSAGLAKKAKEFAGVLKIGRTHLMDATPVTLGQEFGGYARQAALAALRATKAVRALRELPLGGTAVGTGINTHPEFARRICAELSRTTGIEFVEAEDHFEAQASKDAVCEVSGQLKAIAVGLAKIAGDIRLLGSGPRCGIGEILLPATQPGSSIMPGKVNPVMCEMVCQVAAHVIGADAAVTAACRESFFELNVGMPTMAHHLLEAVRLLASASRVFTEKCVSGITANTERCRDLIEGSLAMCTSLAPLVGYDTAAAIAKEAFATGKTVRQIAQEQIKSGKIKLTAAQLDEALNPADMIHPSDKVLPVSA
ncbi:MAG: class II fumarate hydratase [Planctomycetota bacterium]|nr:MAG: class II fumarate hydratase [Planctomycetota bacterium]